MFCIFNYDFNRNESLAVFSFGNSFTSLFPTGRIILIYKHSNLQQREVLSTAHMPAEAQFYFAQNLLFLFFTFSDLFQPYSLGMKNMLADDILCPFQIHTALRFHLAPTASFYKHSEEFFQLKCAFNWDKPVSQC